MNNMKVGHTNKLFEKRLDVIRYSEDKNKIKRAIKALEDDGFLYWKHNVIPYTLKRIDKILNTNHMLKRMNERS
jgi:hypothetical protein